MEKSRTKMEKSCYKEKEKENDCPNKDCACEGGIVEQICEDQIFEPVNTINTKDVDGVIASQWSTVNGDCIIPVENTFTTLKAGYYTIHFSSQIGMFFRYNKIETNKLYRLPNKATDLVLNDISKFLTLEETYKKYRQPIEVECFEGFAKIIKHMI